MIKRLFFFFKFFLVCLAGSYGQVALLQAGSIPMVGEDVVFEVNFESEMSKCAMRNVAIRYLNDVLNPYVGGFHAGSDDHTICRVTDYVNISEKLLQSVGMYMTYNLSLEYKDRGCTLVIWGITYVEKQYYEAQEAASRELFIPVYSASDIMISKAFKLMMTRNASERITGASLARFNQIIADLTALFSTRG